jgi:hypothetical protein
LAFSVEIDKDVVHRVLSAHYRPESDPGGPPGLRFLVTQRTVCGAATYSDANRQRCEPTGFLL